ncbi:exported hypothetical protein [Agrobacterium deltaense RV3]|nr:exported hypothetical protein [Agrobacterium deltaense RV3]
MTVSPSLIPVLVTGIQSTYVCAAEEPFQPKDLGWLDSCDKHRNEGGEMATLWKTERLKREVRH